MVAKFVDDKDASWPERFDALDSHHVAETTELVAKLTDARAQLAAVTKERDEAHREARDLRRCADDAFNQIDLERARAEKAEKERDKAREALVVADATHGAIERLLERNLADAIARAEEAEAAAHDLADQCWQARARDAEEARAALTPLHQDNHKLEHENRDLRAEVERLKDELRDAIDGATTATVEVSIAHRRLKQDGEALHAYAVRLYRAGDLVRRSYAEFDATLTQESSDAFCDGMAALAPALDAAPDSVKRAADEKDGEK